MKPQIVRETSINAYRQIEEEGLLPNKRFQVYRILYEFGPLTASEVASQLKELGEKISHHGLGSRLSELRNMGVVEEIGTRACSITGRNCILWQVTSNLPKKLERKKPSANVIEKRLNIAVDALYKAREWAWLEHPECFKLVEDALIKIRELK